MTDACAFYANILSAICMQTCKHATLHATQVTDACAFYANILSAIPIIRLFGIFMGSAVLIRPHTWPTPTPCTFH